MSGKIVFDYSKLRGRIIEKCGSYKNFANAIGLSSTAVSLKLCNKSYFSQADINKTVDVLDIEPGSVGEYFFTPRL